ncbi:Beta-adrenergic receptor kinase 2 [Desmophyllum pertusum]|uniref:Beta-adrenergic receptor kinase 2 n=1 Tax=Desmophyllum pertusum TaxID=174260 RepID=A0A9W9Y6J2_9CNID|nr:Beta-adrenergic receptor kinase 2 [Desmophyllum pertusum]
MPSLATLNCNQYIQTLSKALLDFASQMPSLLCMENLTGVEEDACQRLSNVSRSAQNIRITGTNILRAETETEFQEWMERESKTVNFPAGAGHECARGARNHEHQSPLHSRNTAKKKNGPRVTVKPAHAFSPPTYHRSLYIHAEETEEVKLDMEQSLLHRATSPRIAQERRT